MQSIVLEGESLALEPLQPANALRPVVAEGRLGALAGI